MDQDVFLLRLAGAEGFRLLVQRGAHGGRRSQRIQFAADEQEVLLLDALRRIDEQQILGGIRTVLQQEIHVVARGAQDDAFLEQGPELVRGVTLIVELGHVEGSQEHAGLDVVPSSQDVDGGHAAHGVTDEEDVVAADMIFLRKFVALAVIQKRHGAFHETVEGIIAFAAPGAGSKGMDRYEAGAAQGVVQILIIGVQRDMPYVIQIQEELLEVKEI